jgi:predicted transcriptional regulator
MNRADLIELTAEIISAYVSNNTVVASDLPIIIGDVHEALSKASLRVGQTEREELRPAVTVKKSVTPDYIVCLEDGKKFKSLKRHLHR